MCNNFTTPYVFPGNLLFVPPMTGNDFNRLYTHTRYRSAVESSKFSIDFHLGQVMSGPLLFNGILVPLKCWWKRHTADDSRRNLPGRRKKKLVYRHMFAAAPKKRETMWSSGFRGSLRGVERQGRRRWATGREPSTTQKTWWELYAKPCSLPSPFFLSLSFSIFILGPSFPFSFTLL